MDTIFALSTPPGKSGVAVVRLTGPKAHHAIKAMCGDIPQYRQASVRVLRSKDGVRLDQSLVLTFEKDKSFTGEDMAELHVHGSIAVVNALLELLGSTEGCRPAGPGEFTRRALENGRLDLPQVEGLADLIESETEAQRRQALRVLSGDLRERTYQWRQALIRATALLEATIDFADEDVPVDVVPEVRDLILDVVQSLRREIAGTQIAERVRQGFEVAIVGFPNTGKSTLLNALAGRDAAITSEVAGTTRDVIEVRMDLGGIPVTLLDTAGIRETNDVVESIGVDRSKARAAESDLRVFLVGEADEKVIPVSKDDIILLAKADLIGNPENSISGATGFGVSELVSRVSDILRNRVSGIGVATRLRHRRAMEDGEKALHSAVCLLELGQDNSDLVAEDLRTAIRALDSLVGRIDIERVLEEIFSSFCIGK